MALGIDKVKYLIDIIKINKKIIDNKQLIYNKVIIKGFQFRVYFLELLDIFYNIFIAF